MGQIKRYRANASFASPAGVVRHGDLIEADETEAAPWVETGMISEIDDGPDLSGYPAAPA